MTITTRDGLIDALGNNSDRWVMDKASLANTAAGQFFSLWQATGTPGAGASAAAAFPDEPLERVDGFAVRCASRSLSRRSSQRVLGLVPSVRTAMVQRAASNYSTRAAARSLRIH